MVPTRSGIFKYLKFSENDKFTGTNSVDSILAVIYETNYLMRPVITYTASEEKNTYILILRHRNGIWLYQNIFGGNKLKKRVVTTH